MVESILSDQDDSNLPVAAGTQEEDGPGDTNTPLEPLNPRILAPFCWFTIVNLSSEISESDARALKKSGKPMSFVIKRFKNDCIHEILSA